NGISDRSNIIQVTFTSSDDEFDIPHQTFLFANYPNPFYPKNKGIRSSSNTTIRYDLSKSGQVNLEIYNIKGQLVKTLVNEFKTAGLYSAVWDGRDNTGLKVSSGIYLYKLCSKDFICMKKMILIQ
ncbi:MAG: T9SS type A sorting domain-containing protein, partial [Candidatus Cloacimonetes bacterium]|nr:T9SS type A sorting domain-containing protein [Candidatus Cloacimonadota bacterium]